MCGITGSIDLAGRRVCPRRLSVGNRRLEHRGPDDQGFLSWSRGGVCHAHKDAGAISEGEVLLGHRRLSIQDLSRSGWQPFLSPDRHAAVVYNGEIYNFLELREGLERDGVVFDSNSDTEVLLKLWLRKGPACLSEFVGMFAFCLLDGRNERAYLVRDFFGIKPLYYAIRNQTLHFASEIQALLGIADIVPSLNIARAFDYLSAARTDHGEETMIEGVLRVMPGEMLVVSLDGSGAIEQRQYWNLPAPAVRDITRAEAAAELRKQFLRSVDLHLRSDAKVGAALSGGIDSSAIVAAIRHLKGDTVDIHAYSYISDDPAISEEKWVDIAGRHANAIVHKVRPTAEEFAADLDAHILTNNEPMGYFNGYLQRRVYDRMRQDGLKVSLDGQGADELFAGYDHFYAPTLVSMLRSRNYGGAITLNKRMTALGFSSGLSTILRTYAKTKLPVGGLGSFRKRPSVPSWLNAKCFAKESVDSFLSPPNAQPRDLFEELTASLNGGLQRLLRCQDLNSMASSIESRVPFLTPRMAEIAFSVPADFHVDEEGVRKALLREALHGIAAPDTVSRMDKRGAPTTNWLRQMPATAHVAFRKSGHPVRALFNSADLEALYARFFAGDESASKHVWRIVNLIRWCELLNVHMPAQTNSPVGASG